MGQGFVPVEGLAARDGSEARARLLLRDGERRHGAGEARSPAGLGARKGGWRIGSGPALGSSPQRAGAARGGSRPCPWQGHAFLSTGVSMAPRATGPRRAAPRAVLLFASILCAEACQLELAR